MYFYLLLSFQCLNPYHRIIVPAIPAVPAVPAEPTLEQQQPHPASIHQEGVSCQDRNSLSDCLLLLFCTSCEPAKYFTIQLISIFVGHSRKVLKFAECKALICNSSWEVVDGCVTTGRRIQII